MAYGGRIGLYSRRRQGFVGLLIVLVFTGMIVVWPLLSVANASNDDQVRADFLLELAPSKSDQTLWNLAYQALSKLDTDTLSAADGDAGLDRVAQAAQALAESTDPSTTGSTYYLLTSVTEGLLDSFVNGNLPQSALFGAAAEVEVISADRAEDLNLPTRTVARSTADSPVILDQLTELQEAVDGLDPLSLALATGTLGPETFQEMDEAGLRDLTASSAFAAAAQHELDLRLADSLPDLSGLANGKMPDDMLCDIDWADDERLLCVVMDNFDRLNEAFKAEFGTDLPILDGYRPLSEQEYVHYNDPNWTAVPGTSNHGWGLAVDFDWDVFKEWDDPEVVWMIENGPLFGWRGPSALGADSDRPEPWHFEFGTVYSDDISKDFYGPAPDVIYTFQFPTK